MHGNRYEVGPGLGGRRVELGLDPFDLTPLAVRLDGAEAGQARPYQISRHAHPKARPELPADPARPTGIYYLALINTQHTNTLGQKVNYTALDDPPAPADPPHPA